MKDLGQSFFFFFFCVETLLVNYKTSFKKIWLPVALANPIKGN